MKSTLLYYFKHTRTTNLIILILNIIYMYIINSINYNNIFIMIYQYTLIFLFFFFQKIYASPFYCSAYCTSSGPPTCTGNGNTLCKACPTNGVTNGFISSSGTSPTTCTINTTTYGVVF